MFFNKLSKGKNQIYNYSWRWGKSPWRGQWWETDGMCSLCPWGRRVWVRRSLSGLTRELVPEGTREPEHVAREEGKGDS